MGVSPAGVYGLIVMAPNYFLERQISQNDPPPITHPEYFYGFVGVALAWQVAFLLISREPVRLRPLMLPPCWRKRRSAWPPSSCSLSSEFRRLSWDSA